MMKMPHAFVKPTVVMMVAVFSFFSILLPSARAALVPTDALVQTTENEDTRQRLQALFDRADVRAQLETWGVDPQEAQARVHTLSETELNALAAQMDQLPAGGSTAGTIAVVSLIAFLVLLFTDIMGYTDIFPFTK